MKHIWMQSCLKRSAVGLVSSVVFATAVWADAHDNDMTLDDAISPDAAQQAPARDDLKNGERFRVEGDRLFFDTYALVEGEQKDIRYSDHDTLRDYLRANDQIKVLELNSDGGGHFPANDIAALVIDFGLDTHVTDTCSSSCVTIFLGGAKRTMSRGGRLGFHQLYWSSDAIEGYYDKNHERNGWETPFDMSSWIYEDTQSEVYARLSYMVLRGVDANFAIQTLRRPDGSMWHPDRSVLAAAGVLTE